MTPREAITAVFVQIARIDPMPQDCREGLLVLEKLVRKDEADKRDVQARAMLGLTRQCTCGTTTPCTVWGHS